VGKNVGCGLAERDPVGLLFRHMMPASVGALSAKCWLVMPGWNPGMSEWNELNEQSKNILNIYSKAE